MTTTFRFSAAAAALLALAACDTGVEADKTQDRQLVGRSSLQQLSPGIWVDPRGCEHWLIDDGVEGYLSARYDPRTGRQVCGRSTAPPEFVTGPFRGGQDINDPL